MWQEVFEALLEGENASAGLEIGDRKVVLAEVPELAINASQVVKILCENDREELVAEDVLPSQVLYVFVVIFFKVVFQSFYDVICEHFLGL